MDLRGLTVALATALAALANPLLQSPGDASLGVRHGRITGIVVTTGDTGPCQTQPDCIAWLTSHCDRRLTRRNPAVYTSIEPVDALADGDTPHYFTVRSPVGTGWIFSGVVVQFWTNDCRELPGVWNSEESPYPKTRATLVIPVGAKWMTVAGGQGLDISWTLY